jgi:hypothetical protein
VEVRERPPELGDLDAKAHTRDGLGMAVDAHVPRVADRF